MRVTVTATIHHPPEVVFRTAASPEKELEWDPGTLKAVEKLTDGPLGKGSRYRGKFKGFGTIEYEFVEFDEPRRFVHQARIAMGTFQHRFTFEPVSGGTRLTQEGELWPNVLGRIASPMVKSMLGKRFRLIGAEVDRYLQSKNTPAAGAKAGATQGTFITSDAIPWKPADPREPDGVQMFVVWGNPKEGPSGVLLKFPAGTDAGWHYHTAGYQGIVLTGKATHTVKGAAPQTGGPGSVWSQLAGQVHDDKCEEGGDCIEFAYFDGKLDFIPVDSPYRY